LGSASRAMPDNLTCILIVEDNFLVASEIDTLVYECGCSVVGPVGSVEDALAIVREMRLDGAILDINLRNEPVWPVAALLRERGVPFLFATGYETSHLPRQFRSSILLSKPLTRDSIGIGLRKIGATKP